MLTEEERLTFINHGYLVKRQILNESSTNRCLQIAWQELEKKSILPKSESWRSHPYLRSRKGVVKLRDEISGYTDLQTLLAENETTNTVIRDLIGDNYLCAGVRGLYPTFPVSRIASRPYSAHVEVHDVQVFVMMYLDDVEPRGAGLYVWPGSHLDVYHKFYTRYDHKPRPDFQPAYARINLQAPVELTGKRGDVMFCHHRLLHCGSNNFNDNVRFGVLVDYLRDDHDDLKGKAPGADIWEDWSDAIRLSSQSAEQVPAYRPTYSATRYALLKLQHAIRRATGKPPDEYAG